MNTLQKTIAYANYVPMYVRVASATIVFAIFLYVYAVVSTVVYTSFNEEIAADVRISGGAIAHLESVHFQERQRFTMADAGAFGLVEAEKVAYVSHLDNKHLSRLD